MIVAGIDFETTSVDPETCHPTEVAIILWEPRTNKIIESISALFIVPEKITNSEITGIDSTLTATYGWLRENVVELISYRIQFADYLMAHHIAFDRTILSRLVQTDQPWIDTMTDIPYPPHIKTRSLSYLAAEHGFINPFPHRALFDVATMIKLAGLYDFEVILKYANSPNMWIRATVSFDDKQFAKDRHFRWDPENRFWVKQIKELNLDYEEERAEFPIDLLPGYHYKEQYL
jgi:DNA polymerase-3 subunit epsilon